MNKEEYCDVSVDKYEIKNRGGSIRWRISLDLKTDKNPIGMRAAEFVTDRMVG